MTTIDIPTNSVEARLRPLALAVETYDGEECRAPLVELSRRVLPGVRELAKKAAEQGESAAVDFARVAGDPHPTRTDTDTPTGARKQAPGDSPTLLQILKTTRKHFEGQPDAADLVGILDECEGYALRICAAAQSLPDQSEEAPSPKLTPDELAVIRQYDARLRAESASPIALFIGGLGGMIGLWLGGPTVAIVVGVLTYFLGAIATVAVLRKSVPCP